MSKTFGSLVSEAAFYADGAKRLSIASMICLDEALMFEQEERLDVGDRIADADPVDRQDHVADVDPVDRRDRADAERLLDGGDGDEGRAALLLEALTAYAEYLQGLANEYGHDQVRKRFGMGGVSP